MMKFDRRKNRLDECQEQKLLHIEKLCFWLLYFMLAVEMLAKIIIFRSKTAVAGEAVCFFSISIVMIALCLHNGIWDRHMDATPKSYAGAALIAGVIVCLINGGLGILSGNFSALGIVILAVCSAALTFAITFALLWFFGGRYHKRCEALDKKADEEDD